MADKNAQRANAEFSAQELMDQNLKNAIQALQVMKDLDKIKTPIEATLYMAGNKSTYRNEAYRQWLTKMDTETKNELSKFIKKHNEKEL